MQKWVPAMFWDDHEERCRGDQPVAGVIRRSGRRVLIDGDDAELGNLLSDAIYYADKWGPDECPPGLKRSAAATVRALA